MQIWTHRKIKDNLSYWPLKPFHQLFRYENVGIQNFKIKIKWSAIIVVQRIPEARALLPREDIGKKYKAIHETGMWNC